MRLGPKNLQRKFFRNILNTIKSSYTSFLIEYNKISIESIDKVGWSGLNENTAWIFSKRILIPLGHNQYFENTSL